jgi:hypothetical protein
VPSNQDIEAFAKTLVEHVRDKAIQSCDLELRGQTRSPMSGRWREAANRLTASTFAELIIPDIVDETVANLLLAIDQGILPLSLKGSDGHVVDLVAQGQSELCGQYLGGLSWRESYSRERYVNDFEDQ